MQKAEVDKVLDQYPNAVIGGDRGSWVLTSYEPATKESYTKDPETGRHVWRRARQAIWRGTYVFVTPEGDLRYGAVGVAIKPKDLVTVKANTLNEYRDKVVEQRRQLQERQDAASAAEEAAEKAADVLGDAAKRSLLGWRVEHGYRRGENTVVVTMTSAEAEALAASLGVIV
jgi:hypothetical protein